MNKTENTTARPWKLEIGSQIDTRINVVYSDGELKSLIACMSKQICDEHGGSDTENAALIVRAVNSHDALVDALENLIKRTERIDKRLLNGHEPGVELGEITRAKAALKLAKGE